MLIALLLVLSLHPARADSKPLLESYRELMAKYPAARGNLRDRCVIPRLRTNRQALRYHKALTRLFAESAQAPNFCGKYFAFGEPVTGGGALFLSDCETGVVHTAAQDFADAKPLSKRESCLVISRAPIPELVASQARRALSGPPRLYRLPLRALEVVAVEDPIWPR